MKKRIIFSAIALATAGLVIGLAPKGVQAAQATEWSTSTNWSVTNGIGGEGREALESDDGQVKLGVMDAWGVQYSKNDKVTLNGLEFTFVYTSRTAGDRAGFYFNQSKTFDYKGVVSIVAPTRWEGQSRWAFVGDHDIDSGTPKTYTDMTGTTAGVGGVLGSQLVCNYSSTLEDGFHFKFEHVTVSWWKMTVTEIRAGYAWDCANIVTDEVTGLRSFTTYFKNSDMDLDDQDGAYLNFIGMSSGYCIVRDFQDGVYQIIPEDPATEEEIADFKAEINGALTGYPEAYVESMADEKAAALAEIDTKTVPSEMMAIVDTFKALVVSEYLIFLGYDQTIDSCVGANFFGTWGQPEYAARANDAGGIIANLESATWGMRGQLIRQYDPLNFEAKINLSGVSVGPVFFLNFSPVSQDYISEASRYFHIELQKNSSGVQVVISNPTCSAHNVSIEEWGTTNVGTFIGQTANLGVDGNVEISFATENGQTEIHVNNTTATIDSSLLGNGTVAYVQMGIFSGAGYSKVAVDVQDAASKAYADGLAAKVAAATEYFTAHEAEVAALKLDEYTDEQYAQYVAGMQGLRSALNGIESYDVVHYGFQARIDALVGGDEVYAAQLAAAKTTAKGQLDAWSTAHLDEYREAEQQAITTGIAGAKEQIDAATSLGAIQQIVAGLQAQLANVKTAAQYEAEEALAAAKVTANATLDAIDLTVYRQAEKTQAQEAIATAKTAIAAAETVAAVEAAVATAQEAIAALKTAAQYRAEELAAAKEAAIASINSKYNELIGANQYTDENAAQLLTLKNQAIEGINAATDVDFIGDIVESVIASMNAVETKPAEQPQPQPEPEQPDQGGEQGGETPAEPEQPAKKGCGSSVLAASALISTLALAGFGLLISKKRKQD